MLRRLLPTLVLAGCIDLTVPAPPPPPMPGALEGTLVFAQPGQATLRPAVGASVELVGSGVRTTSAGDTAFFSLSPVDTNAGAVLIRFDSDGDGTADKQRLLDLEPLKTGRGKRVNAGQLVLGSNATVRGKVLRGDLVEVASGHGGTAVFVPEGPFFALSGDDGSFVFENLPEGRITLAAFREGYAASSESVVLRASEVFPLATLVLDRVGMPGPAQVSGRVLLPEGGPAADVAVSLSGGRSTTTDARGQYSFGGVTHGVYALGFVKEGFLTAELVNLVIAAPSVAVRDVVLAPGPSTPPRLDAGFPAYDAGSRDAGAQDAGPVDAGVDAGPHDAGVDAGPLDAGEDAGAPDAGPVDAGGDAGLLPVALVEAPPAYVLRNSTFTLNAEASVGARPLSFFWSQDAGPTVTIPFNGTPNAATPRLLAPDAGTVLKFNLFVQDPGGRQSAPVSVFVPVAVGPPVAVITGTPTMPVLGGQRVVLSSASSVDPNTSGIVSREWTVSPPQIVATPLDGGQQLQLDMPPSVTPPVVVSVQLVVTNGLTLRSAPVTTSFQLAVGTLPQWYVDAGAQQTVGGGDVVTLRGGAFAPSTGATFSYRWSPDREPDAGAADWQLTDPTSPTTTFVAPRIDGPTPRLIGFTLTATDTAGTLTPPVRVAQTFVNVVDRRSPQIVGTSLVGGTGSVASMWVDFDEDVAPGSITSVNVSAVSGSPQTGVVERFLVNRRRVILVLRPTLVPGFMYTLSVANVDDLAFPMANRLLVPLNTVFLARNSWTAAFESTATSTSEPWPGLVVRRNPDFSVSAFTFGRREGTTWFGAPFDPLSCTAGPCALATDATAPSLALAGPLPRGHKGWLVNDEPVATLQVANLQGAPAAIFRNSGGTWAAVPAPPSALFSDGTTLSSVRFDDGGVTHVVLDGGAWTTASLITTNLAEYPTDAVSDPFVFGNASLGARPMVVLKSSKSENQRVSINGPPWGPLVSAGTGPETRVTTMMENYPAAAFVFTLRPSGAIDELITGSVNNAFSNVVTGVTSFDALSNYSSIWLATAASGVLELRTVNFGAPSPVRVAGPLRGGMPGFALNHDVACEAARPELAMTDGRLFVAWQERCGAGPWRVYVRALE
ncbi:MAG: carboxypeptidase regulatory-like domain-containing protein [Myxococcaceae bacterium]|jgi:hypothetical protein|nr:carboxypeptidase regulatory-like domain-containing protein [Myxococcaceae bacterium]